MVWSLSSLGLTEACFQLYSVVLVSAKTVTIVVGGNGTTQDASLIFQPQEVTAQAGDFVVFNCTFTSWPLLASPHVLRINACRYSTLTLTAFPLPFSSSHEWDPLRRPIHIRGTLRPREPIQLDLQRLRLRPPRHRQRNRHNDANCRDHRGQRKQYDLVLRYLGMQSRRRRGHQRERLEF